MSRNSKKRKGDLEMKTKEKIRSSAVRSEGGKRCLEKKKS